MTGRKRLARFLLIAGVLLLATGGFFWRGDAGRRGEIVTETAALEDSVKRINQRLQAINLKYRGFRESTSSIPDSVRRHGGAISMEISQGYNKAIRRLEMSERDINLEIAALKRESTAERAIARDRAIPAAAGGAIALLIGAILFMLPARRVGA